MPALFFGWEYSLILWYKCCQVENLTNVNSTPQYTVSALPKIGFREGEHCKVVLHVNLVLGEHTCRVIFVSFISSDFTILPFCGHLIYFIIFYPQRYEKLRKGL